MPDFAFAAHIPAGKIDAWRSAMRRCHPDNPDYVGSRRALGIRREAAWLQSTPDGDLAVVYIEADDLALAFRGFATSSEPFDVWFREAIHELHGIDLGAPAPPPQLVVDYTG